MKRFYMLNVFMLSIISCSLIHPQPIQDVFKVEAVAHHGKAIFNALPSTQAIGSVALTIVESEYFIVAAACAALCALVYSEAEEVFGPTGLVGKEDQEDCFSAEMRA